MSTLLSRILCVSLFLVFACTGQVVPEAGNESSVAMSPARSAATAKKIARLVNQADSAGIARTLRSECNHLATQSQCFESQLVPIATAGNVRLAMGALGQLAHLESDVRTGGHVYAHAIGIAAGKNTDDVAGAFAQCSEAFQSGCYHGVIQAWFARLDRIGGRDANGLCEAFRANETQRWIRFQCVHGMGHGLTMLYHHDLVAGLKGCDLLTDDWDKESCYGGAFMENIVNVTTPHHPANALSQANALSHESPGAVGSADERSGHHMTGTSSQSTQKFKAIDPTNQQYPCSIMADRYLRSCYEMQTSVMLHNNEGDIAAAARSCDIAPKAMRTVCYASLGRDVSSYSQQKHPEAIRMCSLGDSLYQPWCYAGVVKNFIDLNARASDGIAFCRSVRGDANKQLCYASVGEQILILDPDVADRETMCASAEASYLVACLYGARVISSQPAALNKLLQSVAM